MADVYIRFEREDDLEFVRAAVTAAGRRWVDNITLVGTPGFELMERLNKALNNPTPSPQSATPVEHADKPRRAKRRSRSEIEAEDYIPNLCKAHPKYGAKRPPRTSCEGCWAAFGRFNPGRLTMEKLKFERHNATS